MRALPLALLGLTLCGCSVVGELLPGGQASVVASLTVHNRTQASITLVSADGEQLHVPACGDASDPDFRIDSVRIGSDGFYIQSFGRSDGAGQELTWVQVAGDGRESGFTDRARPIDPLPGCRGLPQVQRNVPLDY